MVVLWHPLSSLASPSMINIYCGVSRYFWRYSVCICVYVDKEKQYKTVKNYSVFTVRIRRGNPHNLLLSTIEAWQMFICKSLVVQKWASTILPKLISIYESSVWVSFFLEFENHLDQVFWNDFHLSISSKACFLSDRVHIVTTVPTQFCLWLLPLLIATYSWSKL